MAAVSSEDPIELAGIAHQIPLQVDESLRDSLALLKVTDNVDETMLRVSGLVCSLVEGCAFSSISELHGETIRTRGANDPRAEAIDQIQHETREGPCWVAATERIPLVYAVNTAEDDRWPTFSRRTAEEVGAFSLMACRLVVGQPPRALGALNMYGAEPAAFDRADQHIAMLLAAVTAVLLDASRRESQLTEALQSRGLIGQAMGILMAQSDVTADQAFDQLRAASQRMNIKLRDLAASIAASTGNKGVG